MTGSISPTSQTELSHRRRKLRRQRRIRLLQAIWRVLAVGGLAGGLIWLTTLPIWLIRNPEQIKIEGNRFLPTQAVRSLLPISYPQSILWLEPQKISSGLAAKAPVSEVIVNRQLFPPSLTVRIKERYPVAIALTNSADSQSLAQRSAKGRTDGSRIGLLDENGTRIPLENYSLLERSVKLPTLKVIGNQEHYRPYWSKLYQDTSRSPVKISEIDCQNPANLILKSDLGMVHLGPYSSRFSEQIKTLDRMRKLSKQVNPSQIAYIDLRNPDSPHIQMSGSKDSVKSDVPQRSE